MTTDSATLEELAKQLDTTRRWLFVVGLAAIVAVSAWRVQSCRLDREVSSRRFVLHGDDGQTLMTIESEGGVRFVMRHNGGQFEASVGKDGSSKLAVTSHSDSSTESSSQAILTVSPRRSELVLSNSYSNEQIVLSVGPKGVMTLPADALQQLQPLE